MHEPVPGEVVPVVDVTGRVEESDAREVWAVYEPVFGDHASYDAWWTSVWDKHSTRAGFRLVRARVDGELVGFGYGYTGEPRQWWADRAAEVLAPGVAAAWLGGHFEVVSLAVLARDRGRGVGDRLLTALTADLPHDRRLLMTSSDPLDPARRLYARHGWVVIGPGFAPDQVILGWAAADAAPGGPGPSQPTHTR